MDRRNALAAAGAAAGMLLLILDSRCAAESAQQAVELCIGSVIPSLFPFLFLSGLVTDALWGIRGPVMQRIGWLFHIPPGGESLLLPAFLGGYPAGAIAIGDAFRTGQIKRETAQRLLCHCCNAGPAFLFGMVASQFPEKRMVWSLWGIHLLSAALVGALIHVPAQIPEAAPENRICVSEALIRSVKSMAMICGWILLFRILMGFLDRWFFFLLPDGCRVFLWGFLELSNGCMALHQIENVSIRFVAASAMLAFGGVCVAMQTASAVSGLSMKGYFSGKMLQTGFSVLLSVAVCRGFGLTTGIFCIGFLFLRHFRKKRSSIPAVSGV